MERLVKPLLVSARSPTAAQGGEPYSDRVLKYLPAEVVLGYAALGAILSGVTPGDEAKESAAWAAFLVGLVATPLYLLKSERPRGQQWGQVVIAIISFVIWAYMLGGPFADRPGYRAWIGGLAAASWSLLIGAFQPTVHEPEVPVSGPTG